MCSARWAAVQNHREFDRHSCNSASRQQAERGKLRLPSYEYFPIRYQRNRELCSKVQGVSTAGLGRVIKLVAQIGGIVSEKYSRRASIAAWALPIVL